MKKKFSQTTIIRDHVRISESFDTVAFVGINRCSRVVPTGALPTGCSASGRWLIRPQYLNAFLFLLSTHFIVLYHYRDLPMPRNYILYGICQIYYESRHLIAITIFFSFDRFLSFYVPVGTSVIHRYHPFGLSIFQSLLQHFLLNIIILISVKVTFSN